MARSSQLSATLEREAGEVGPAARARPPRLEWRRDGNKAVRWHLTLLLLHAPQSFLPSAVTTTLARNTAHLFRIRWIVSCAVLPSRADKRVAAVEARSDPAMEEERT